MESAVIRIEISIAKEKTNKIPRGSTEALKQKMFCRISRCYDDTEVVVKSVSNYRLSVL